MRLVRKFQKRLSRESGNPDGRRFSLDSCLRRNDGYHAVADDAARRSASYLSSVYDKLAIGQLVFLTIILRSVRMSPFTLNL